MDGPAAALSAFAATATAELLPEAEQLGPVPLDADGERERLLLSAAPDDPATATSNPASTRERKETRVNPPARRLGHGRARVGCLWSEEVIRMSSTTEQPERRPADDFVSTEELIRRQGIKPITSVEEFAQDDPFDSDEEYEEFLVGLYASRRSGIS